MRCVSSLCSGQERLEMFRESGRISVSNERYMQTLDEEGEEMKRQFIIDFDSDRKDTMYRLNRQTQKPWQERIA